MNQSSKYRFAIDRGGTFTDIYAETPSGTFEVVKLLSRDPKNYQDAPTEGILRVIRKMEPDFSGAKIPTEKIEWIRMGTTLATNALLERKGHRMALMITKGFKDLLEIGSQNRPNLFDLKVTKPELLYEEVFEVDERVRVLTDETPSQPLNKQNRIVEGLSGERFEILKAPDENDLTKILDKIRAKGIDSLAVVLLHSYGFQAHERIIGDLARKAGFRQISLSSAIRPILKMVPRGDTCMVDAYLTPLLKEYMGRFLKGFTTPPEPGQILFMRSDGGLVQADDFLGCDAILSGPAGGVVGLAKGSGKNSSKRPLIGFDMGGTSTDVSRFGGEFELNFETETAGVRIQSPQLKINTVAAGGGSRLFFDHGLFKVGPESSGAEPGPLCYKKRGYLSLTDANLFLGRIQPEFFPKIFGPAHDQPLDSKVVERAFQQMAERVNHYQSQKNLPKMTSHEIAMGFVKVANQTMIRSIREISVLRGYEIKEHRLVCFGGAGGQHACAIAKELGMNEILIHRFGGILSAYGLGLADRVAEKQEPASEVLSSKSLERIKKRLDRLQDQATEELVQQGFDKTSIRCERLLNLRYQRTDTALMIKDEANQSLAEVFESQYKKEFGFHHPDREIEVDDIRVVCKASSDTLSRPLVETSGSVPKPRAFVEVYFDEHWRSTPVFSMESLKAGQVLPAPALVIEATQTVVIEPDCKATVTTKGDLLIEIHEEASTDKIGTQVDPVRLSIFSSLFMSIAEQMGRSLQKTAVSTNIKERQDFSCALFDSQGRLVANAPHQPVHLGAMSEAVQAQIRLHQETISPNEVYLTNHPSFGGSHLPDLTVISPVVIDEEICFYVANRGHHADIGGITPGSMPSFSTDLTEEGAAIKSFTLVKNGVFQEEGVLELLKNNEGQKHNPKVKPAREPKNNLSDLKAQIAANQKGVVLLGQLADKYGKKVIEAYMDHIRENAAESVREMFGHLAERLKLKPKDQLSAEDFMDDGSAIRLTVFFDQDQKEVVFDFTETDPQVMGNWNAPKAVTASAVLYCLRSMLEKEIPLNQGCLVPVKILLKKGSLLDPRETAAVVGGNVLTSQRVVDVIFKAFHRAAASQGCMNNLTFGDEKVAYYETIGGGSGAGPDWEGQSGVHTHMTNTRITDPEILEKRYPVLLRVFSLREGSGGEGTFKGGDGIHREIEFLKPLEVSILSERRVFAPYGLMGGKEGAKGVNQLIRKDGEIINLGGKAHVRVEPGDLISIKTPGGGGFA